MAHPDFTKLTEADILAMLATVNTNTIIGDTLPENPDPGSLWFDQTNAKLYTYYNDGDSGQWVSAGGGRSDPLVNVDNTSDLDKPVSTATQLALDAITGNSGSTTYDPPLLADGSGVTTTVTVTGASLGEFAQAAFSADLQGVSVTAWVSALDTVSVRFQNETGGTVNLSSATLNARAN